jgi:hypothetical protein
MWLLAAFENPFMTAKAAAGKSAASVTVSQKLAKNFSGPLTQNNTNFFFNWSYKRVLETQKI